MHETKGFRPGTGWPGSKRGLATVEDMFKWETLQFEAELEAEGLPIDALPLEAAMALAAQEDTRPLHKLSLVSVY